MSLVNPEFGDRYFSDDDGLAEATHVFVGGNRMVERQRAQGCLRVAETGFGTGLNLLAAVGAMGRPDPAGGSGPGGRLVWSSVEKYPLATGVVAGALAGFAPVADILEAYLAVHPGTALRPGAWNCFGFTVAGISVEVRLWYGDVLEMLSSLGSGPRQELPDCWVLDGHSPALNPDMWSPAVFAGMAAASRTDPASSFASYTAAGMVKSGLRAAGFLVRRQAGFGRKRHMITGVFTAGQD